MRSAYRLHCTGQLKRWNDDLSKLFKGSLAALIKEPQDRIRTQPMKEQIYKISLPTREDWKTSGEPRHGQIWFTDGSKTAEGIGAGFCGPRRANDTSIKLDNFNTVFQAELLAILKCADYLQLANTKDEVIGICTDSQAALKALLSYTVSSWLVKDTRTSLNNLARDNKVLITWIPGHSGWKGNERADKLAKLGTTLAPTGEKLVRMPYQEGLNRLEMSLKGQQLKAWNSYEGGQTSKSLLGEGNSLCNRAEEILKLNRADIRIVVELLTGHNNLNKFQHQIGKRRSPACEKCGDNADETSIHFLCECPALIQQRRKWFGPALIEPEEIRKLSARQILGFSISAGYKSH